MLCIRPHHNSAIAPFKLILVSLSIHIQCKCTEMAKGKSFKELQKSRYMRFVFLPLRVLIIIRLAGVRPFGNVMGFCRMLGLQARLEPGSHVGMVIPIQMDTYYTFIRVSNDVNGNETYLADNFNLLECLLLVLGGLFESIYFRFSDDDLLCDNMSDHSF